MSASDRKEYFREYHKKYYQDNKELMADKRNETSKRRSKFLNIVYRSWRQGKLISIGPEAEEELNAELEAVDKKEVKIVFEDSEEDES